MFTDMFSNLAPVYDTNFVYRMHMLNLVNYLKIHGAHVKYGGSAFTMYVEWEAKDVELSNFVIWVTNEAYDKSKVNYQVLLKGNLRIDIAIVYGTPVKMCISMNEYKLHNGKFVRVEVLDSRDTIYKPGLPYENIVSYHLLKSVIEEKLKLGDLAVFARSCLACICQSCTVTLENNSYVVPFLDKDKVEQQLGKFCNKTDSVYVAGYNGCAVATIKVYPTHLVLTRM